MSALAEKTTLVERAAPQRENGDLAGARVDRRNPTGIEVAPDTWMREDSAGGAMAVILSGFASLVFSVLVAIGFAVTGGDAPVTVIAIELSFAAMAILFAVVAARITRAGLRVSARGVYLRGMIRTHRLSLAEVVEFVPGTFSSIPLRSEIGMKLVRKEGRDLDVWAIGGGAPATKADLESGLAAMQPLCDELNRLLRSSRA